MAAVAQEPFVDDAHREVTLPASGERVFAAGAPAEVLLYKLAREKLAGPNIVPSPAPLTVVPPELRGRRAIVNLPDRDDRRYDAEPLALDVDLYIDDGDPHHRATRGTTGEIARWLRDKSAD